MMLDQELSDGGEIIGNHAPTDPTFHADFTMSQTAVQVAGASQLADAAFNSIAETLSGSKPGLLFLLATMVGLIAGLRQAHMTHPQGTGLLLVFGRMNAAIATNFMGWFSEHLAMMLQTGNKKLRFIRVALQQTIFTDQASVNFSVPDLAPKLGLFGFGFASANQGGMRLKETEHLIASRCRLPMQDPLLGLLDDSFHQRQIVIQFLLQPLSRGVLQGGQAGLDLGHLQQQGLHHYQQLLIQFQAGFCRVFGLRAAQTANIPS